MAMRGNESLVWLNCVYVHSAGYRAGDKTAPRISDAGVPVRAEPATAGYVWPIWLPDSDKPVAAYDFRRKRFGHLPYA